MGAVGSPCLSTDLPGSPNAYTRALALAPLSPRTVGSGEHGAFVEVDAVCGSRRGRLLAWPTASWRPSAGCGWQIPVSAPSRCSPSCGSSSQTWERAPGRSARRWRR
eukprot:scaffold39028_cov65-Phaeocystis_antarctica.AAC.8